MAAKPFFAKRTQQIVENTETGHIERVIFGRTHFGERRQPIPGLDL
jgi:hypothetical protein